MSRQIHGDALRVAVGVFCLLLGALVLVAPHKLADPSFDLIRPMAPVLGVMLISGGMMLVGTSLLGVARPLFVTAHIAAATPLVTFGIGYLAASNWHGALLLLATAAWTLVAAALPPRSAAEGQRSINLLALSLGSIALGFGASIVFEGAADGLAPNGPLAIVWFGAIFVAGGLGVLLAQAPRLRGMAVSVTAKVVLGLIFLAHAVFVALPAEATLGVLYLGLFGTALILLPWMRRRTIVDASSLQAQLAVALLGITVVAVTSMIAVLGAREERSTVAAQLTVNQALAEALSANVAEYVRHHQQALAALANTPGLATMSPEQQTALLRSTISSFPEVVSLSTFDARGRAIARGDGRPLSDATSDWMLSVVSGKRAPLLTTISQLVGRPVFASAAALRDERGRVVGIATIVVESSHLVELLDRSSISSIAVFIVDQSGIVIGHSRDEVAQERPSYAWRESVQHLLSGTEAAGSTIDQDAGDQLLAGYARVDEIGWGVVVERPASVALAEARTSREIAYGLLMLAILTAAAIGVVISRRVTLPLETLSASVERFAEGDPAAPVPTGGTSEVRALARAFVALRRRLAERTAEREQALQTVRATEETLR
jgi:HAMP domain-containing protein